MSITKQTVKSSKQSSEKLELVKMVSSKEPVEIEEIVKIFARDLQHSIRQRFKNKHHGGMGHGNLKKIPYEI